MDRLAVRTFVLPFDPVVIREALMRERLRGGQTFYVCPRLADIDGVAERLTYLSAAGGAFLEWLEGKELPGVAALMR